MLYEIWEKHKGKILGIAGGVFLSIMYLIAGFWDMMMCAFLLLVGFYFGQKSDLNEPWFELSKLVDWLKEKWDIYR